MNKQTIGLIGCGIWGRNILRDLLALGHDVFVVDIDPLARALGKARGADAVFVDIARLPNVDGIIIATPASTHADTLECVLDRDVPVFVEKPLTDDVGSARRIGSLAPDRVFVLHIWMYHPGVEKLAELASTRTLGEVSFLYTTRVNWTSPRTDVDIVWTALPHDLTIAQAVLGKLPEPASAVAECIGGTTVGMVATLHGPPHCLFNVSARYQDKRREIRLHCTDGVAVLPSGEGSFVEIARGRALEPEVERLSLSTESALQRELRACMAYLNGGAPPRSGLEEGVRVVEKIARLRALAGLDT
jgi:predicted dehydrogenase